VIEIAQPDPLQGTDQAARDLVAAPMTKVLSTASTTKANDAALDVSGLIWRAATPVWITTSENSRSAPD
jgi:hypothetical protein